VTGLLVPFTIDYRPLWTGLGVCGAYLAAGLSLTYYARRRLGARRWRKAHRAIPVAWALGAVHALGAGTDAGSLWLQAPIAVTVALVVVLLARRLTMRRPSAPARTRARVPAPARDPEPRTSKAPAPAALWLGSPQNRA